MITAYYKLNGMLENIKMLIGTDDKLADEFTLKNIVILISCAIKDADKLYPQIF